MEFQRVLQGRRTIKQFTGAAIDREQIESLLTAAITAPNHRRNQPWRFYIIEQPQLAQFSARLLEGCAEAFADKGPEFAEKKRISLSERIEKLGAMVYVSSARHDNPLIDKENYAAVCCAVQNMMLAAFDQGLGSFWCTGTVFYIERSLKLVGIDPAKEEFVGAIWLGEPACEADPPAYDLQKTITYWQN